MKQLLDNPYHIKQIILFLYRSQSVAEQTASVTVESNGVGFNMVDANIMTSFAKQILAGKGLSEKQLATARLILPKYHKQLENEAWKEVHPPSIGQSPLAQVAGAVTDGKPEQALAKSLNVNGVLKIESNGGLVFFPNIYPSKQIKTIGFSRWEGGAWHQHTPKVAREVIEDVKKMFGDIYVDFEIAKALTVPTVAMPTFVTQNEKLMPHQHEAIKFQLEHPHSLVALAPRLGKTVTTIFSVKAAGSKKVLVVTLLSLLQDWQGKIKTWSGEDASIVYKKQLPVDVRWTVTNFDTVRKNPSTFLNEGFDCIVIDESLLVKNRGTARTKIIKQLIETNKPKHCWLLSGAPTSRYYNDLWSQLNMLNPKRFSSYWKFAERYCQIEANQWSKYNIVGNKPDASKNIQSDLQDILFVRSFQDVTDLPPFEPENICIPMAKHQEKMYNEMEELFFTILDGDGTKLLAKNVISQFIRLIQIASNPLLVAGKDDSNKWSAVSDWIEISDKPVIVWTSFIETARHLQERLSKKWNVDKLTGETKSDRRAEIVRKFQAKELDVLIAHPAVGKYGLDLFNAGTVIYLERGMSGDDYYQSLNRTRKLNQTSFARIVHFLSSKSDGSETVDHVIDKLLSSRMDSTLKLTTAGLKKLFKGEN
jgi:SNF2 family DNA or RNA helicase